MSDDVQVAVAGLGYWGPNLLRALESTPGCRVVAVADHDPARVEATLRARPHLTAHESIGSLALDPQVDAVALALPITALADAATLLLGTARHVLIEKPMAASYDQGSRIAEAADHAQRVAMTDFTFVYSPPVQTIAELLDKGQLGAPRYYSSTRINLGRFRSDTDVIADLVSHDIAILAWLLGGDPVAVTAVGQRGEPHGSYDTAHVTLAYANGFRAFLQASWMAPVKVRTSLLACTEAMVWYDDVRRDEQLRIYELADTFDPGREDAVASTPRLGDVRIPQLPAVEPLRAVAGAFVDAIRTGAVPPTGPGFALRVLRVIEAARRSLQTGRTEEIQA